ncbi:MAG: hypothetical protein WC937_06520 [Candidatus Omnitrophota bacterium]|jgi:hypothetical protein
MTDEKEPTEEPQLPAIKIIKQIQEGIIDAEKLPKEMRQACVECLLTQFTPISKIAVILKRDERTIKRDKKEIEQRNVEKPSLDYSLELISELMRKANATQEHLMSLAREDGATVQEKSQAAFYAWKGVQEQMKLLQSLGYLPEQPMRIQANITQEETRDVVKLKEELAEVEKVISEQGRGDDPAIAGLLKSIKQEIAIAEANNNMDEIKKLISKPKEDTGNSNEPEPSS